MTVSMRRYPEAIVQRQAKHLGRRGEARNETQQPISCTEDMYKYVEQLQAVARR